MKPRQPTSGMAGLWGGAIGAILGHFFLGLYLGGFIGSIVGAVLLGIIFSETDRWLQEDEDNDQS